MPKDRSGLKKTRLHRISGGSARDVNEFEEDQSFASGRGHDGPAQAPLDLSLEEEVVLKKKDKQRTRRELFLQRLESSHSPYSKSHNKRLKRKAKEKLGGGLQDVAAALLSIENPDAGDEATEEMPAPKGNTSTSKKSKLSTSKPGMIAEGKGQTQSSHQRKQILKTEKKRQLLLLSMPEFTTNPFQAVRTHAQNTLVKHVR